MNVRQKVALLYSVMSSDYLVPRAADPVANGEIALDFRGFAPTPPWNEDRRGDDERGTMGSRFKCFGFTKPMLDLFEALAHAPDEAAAGALLAPEIAADRKALALDFDDRDERPFFFSLLSNDDLGEGFILDLGRFLDQARFDKGRFAFPAFTLDGPRIEVELFIEDAGNSNRLGPDDLVGRFDKQRVTFAWAPASKAAASAGALKKGP